MQLRQPSQQLLGFWQTHKFKARRGQTFINDYHHIFTDILKTFVKNLSWNVHSLDTCHCSGWTNVDVLACYGVGWFFTWFQWRSRYPGLELRRGGGKIIEYILRELMSIIWIRPAFELHCWMRLLLCHCSSISWEMNVPSWVARMLGKEWASLACCHPSSAACRDNWHSLLCTTTAGGQTVYRQEEGPQARRSKPLVLWGSPPQTSVGTGAWLLCLWDSVSQPIK